MTLPVHPLCGQALEVRRYWTGPGGERFVDVVHPSGESMRLPLSWTERGQPFAVGTARATGAELLALAKLVRGLGCDRRNLGPGSGGGVPAGAERNISDKSEQAGAATDLVDPDRAAATSPGRAVGNARAAGGGRGRRPKRAR